MRISIRAFTFAVFGSLLFFGIGACKKDATFSSDLANSTNLATPQKTLSIKVNNTKSWFEDRQKKSLLANTTHLKKMQPLWDKAITYRNVVEVPFQIDGKFHIPTMAKGTQTQLGRQRLIIYSNGKGMTNTYVASYMPSLNFNGKIKNINAVNLKYQKFDGIVRLYTVNKKYLGTMHYDKGILRPRSIAKDVNKLSTRGGDCYEPGEDPESEWECWLEGNETICDLVYVVKPDCPTEDEDPCQSDFPPPSCDEDPCNSVNPPPYCNNDDPCSGPNPPPYCGGNGDFCEMFPELCDPCVLFPTLCGGGDDGGGDNSTCTCQNTEFIDESVCQIIFSSNQTPGEAIVVLDMNYVTSDCTVPSYSAHGISRVLDNNGGSITFDNNNTINCFINSQPKRINENDPKCGYTVGYRMSGRITWSGRDLGAAPLNLTESYNGISVGFLK